MTGSRRSRGPRKLAGRPQVTDTHVAAPQPDYAPQSNFAPAEQNYAPADQNYAPAEQNYAPYAAAPSGSGPSGDSDAIFAAIESLAGLHQRGILSDEEFATKKAELLGRI